MSMAREIKFRAWDKELNRFLEDYEWIVDHEDGVVSGFYYADSAVELELTQFTGMNDKNKWQIYEGDIITWNGFEYIIEFSNGEFIASEIDNSPAILARYNWKESEIIDNVMERKIKRQFNLDKHGKQGL